MIQEAQHRWRLTALGKRAIKGRARARARTTIYINVKGKGKSDGKNPKGKGKGQQKGQDYGQGKSQQKGNAKGDGQKGQKGKGDGGPVKTCFTCSKPGYLARDCWRVRQQQSQGDASSTWTSTSGSQATTAKTAAVKRIVEVDSVSRAFDL